MSRKNLRTTRNLTGAKYEERRGLRQINIDLDDDKSLPETAEAVTKKMYRSARLLLKEAGEKSLEETIRAVNLSKVNDHQSAINSALLAWTADIALRWGFVSPITAAAKLLGTGASLTLSLGSASPDERSTTTNQIYEFADAWHWFHMERFGEHELAYAKRQHVAGTNRGGKATADKAARRAQIIRAEIDALKSSGASLKSAAKVARDIRAKVDEQCGKAGLSKAASDDAFAKAVASVLKKRKGLSVFRK